MQKQAVLITGGARRLGRVMAERFAQAGYDVALHYFCSHDDAEMLQKSLNQSGVQCQLFQADLRDPAAVGQLMKDVTHRMPHVRVLINNASSFTRRSFMDTDAAHLQAEFATNFTAPFFLTQAFAEQIGEGAVINMLDMAVNTNRTPYFAYLLAKKALAEFTLMAARDLAPNIRVNGICPGLVLPYAGTRDVDEYERTLPMKRKASADDIAEAALSLVTNRFAVGQLLFVDGGEHLIA